jgi:hypothetical protein
MVVFIDKQRGKHRHGRSESLPSPDRIRELAAAIRSNWTAEERERRASIARYVQIRQIPLWPTRENACAGAAE